jgi:ABC-2 type transport system ATP-binding protein
MEEAERLCDRVVIMDHGRVIADDTVSGLHHTLPAARSAALQFEGPPLTDGMLADLGRLPGIGAVTRIPGGIRIDTDDFGAPLMRCLEALSAQGRRITSALTGRALRDEPAPAVPP